MPTCPSCQQDNRPEARFCGHCGAALRGALPVKKLAPAAGAVLLAAALGWGGYAAWDRLTLPGRAQKAVEAADGEIAEAAGLGAGEKDLAGARTALRTAKELVVIGNCAQALESAGAARASAGRLVRAARGRNTESYAHFFVEGGEELKSGDYAAALAAFEKALEARRGDKAAGEKAELCRQKLYEKPFNEAEALHKSGNWEEAITVYERALVYRKDAPAALAGKAECGKKIAGREEREAAEKRKKIAEALNRGREALAGGKYKSAIAEFRAAIDLGGGKDAVNLSAEAEGKAAGAKAEAERKAEAQAKWRALIKDMVLIAAGEFLMGSPEGEGSTDEHPRHRVRLDAYYIDKHEVTFERYDKYCAAAVKSKPSDGGWGRGSRPVINVSWDEAEAYCNWAGKRLPTEAEWEKAARGGADTKYSFGNDEAELGEYAWYSANSGNQTHPVGEKKPNQYGLYDMHGNVWEWVSDWYDGNYYRNSPANNPKGPDSGTDRGLRGGSWLNVHGDLRAAVRNGVGPGNGYDGGGFRCVVSAQDSK